MLQQEKASDYFKRHPLNEECFITADNRVFHTKGGAEGFAGTLLDQTVKEYKRKLVMMPKDVLNQITDDNDTTNQDTERLAKIVELENLELVSANYNTMKGLVKYFELPTEDQKSETLIQALTDFKITLEK